MVTEPLFEFCETYSKFPLAIYFTYVSVYASRLLSPFISSPPSSLLPLSTSLFSISAPSPLYDQYCKDHFRDGHCDQGCNSAECEWDGLDCAEHVPERLAAGTLVLVVLMPPEQLRRFLNVEL